MSDYLLNLDGTPSSIRSDMLAVKLAPALATTSFKQALPGDAIWSYRELRSSDIGLLLLRDGLLVASIEPTTAVITPPAPVTPLKMPTDMPTVVAKPTD